MKKIFTKNVLKSVLLIALVMVAVVMNKDYAKAAGGYVVDLKTNQQVTELTPHIITTADEDDYLNSSAYEVSISATEKQIVMPIKVDKKGIVQYAYYDANGSSSSFSVSFYTDVACTSKLDYSNYNGTVKIPKAGTYYVNIYAYSTATVTGDSIKVSFLCNMVSGEDSQLKNKEWKVSAIIDSDNPIYYKVVVNNTGFIKLDIDTESSFYLTLCSSNKKALSDEIYIYSTDNKAAFAVPKGTYYLKCSTSYSSNVFAIRSTSYSVKDASGSSKSKAAALKIGTEKKGLLLPGDKTSKNDWFKFTLTKATKVNLVVNGNVSSGKIRFEITSSSLRGSASGYLNKVGDSYTTQLKTYTTETLPKGTYYIRFYKDSSKTSGDYSVKIAKAKR